MSTPRRRELLPRTIFGGHLAKPGLGPAGPPTKMCLNKDLPCKAAGNPGKPRPKPGRNFTLGQVTKINEPGFARWLVFKRCYAKMSTTRRREAPPHSQSWRVFQKKNTARRRESYPRKKLGRHLANPGLGQPGPQTKTPDKRICFQSRGKSKEAPAQTREKIWPISGGQDKRARLRALARF